MPVPRAINHYEALNLHPTASASDIKSRFYALSKEYHPDRVLSRAEHERALARKRFDAVSEAYSVLGNPDSRREYDLTIRGSASSSENHYYRTPGEQRKTYSGLNRTRSYYAGDFGPKQPSGSYPKNPYNVGLGGGYATGLNDDVPHFDFERHVRQQFAYEAFRQQRLNQKSVSDALKMAPKTEYMNYHEAENRDTEKPMGAERTTSTERTMGPERTTSTEKTTGASAPISPHLRRRARTSQSTQSSHMHSSHTESPEQSAQTYARVRQPQFSQSQTVLPPVISVGKVAGVVGLVSGAVYATMMVTGLI